MYIDKASIIISLAFKFKNWSDSMKTLKNKTVLVTGAARGIGAAIAKNLAAKGAIVTITDVLDESGIETAKSIGSGVTYRHLDVTNEEDWKHVVSEMVNDGGSIDILVNNAGMLVVKPILDCTSEQFRKIFDINVAGILYGIKAVAPLMLKSQKGSIINMSSMNGLRGAAGVSLYVASKHAVIGLTRSAAAELGPQGIRVNAVCPGTTDTDMVKEALGAGQASVAKAATELVPLRRIAQPDEIAEMVAFLASDSSSYCNGGEFVVDGGLINNI